MRLFRGHNLGVAQIDKKQMWYQDNRMKAKLELDDLQVSTREEAHWKCCRAERLRSSLGALGLRNIDNRSEYPLRKPQQTELELEKA